MLRRTVVPAIITLVALLMLQACLPTSAEVDTQETPAPPTGTPPPKETVSIPVKVGTVDQRDIQEALQLTGTAQPWDQFEVSSEIAGRVETIQVDEGQWVEKGQQLLLLNQEKRLIELESRKAMQARAQVELEFARRKLQRGEALLEKGAISQDQVDTLEQVVQVAEANLRINSAAVDSMAQEIEDTWILAPATGQISRRDISVGETVSPGEPLMRVIQLNPLKVVTEVAEPYLHRVRPGDSVKMIFEAVDERPRQGNVHYLHPVANPQSGAFPAEIRLPNPSNNLQPGMVARVRLLVGVWKDALTIPLDAVVDDQGRYYVFAIEDGLARKRAITVIRRVEDRAVVKGPLEAGDTVVTAGNVNLTDGTPVEVVG